jgi:hypothetical protein
MAKERVRASRELLLECWPRCASAAERRTDECEGERNASRRLEDRVRLGRERLNGHPGEMGEEVAGGWVGEDADLQDFGVGDFEHGEIAGGVEHAAVRAGDSERGGGRA